MSAQICATTRCCAPVSRKGSDASKASSEPGAARSWRAAPRQALRAPRRRRQGEPEEFLEDEPLAGRRSGLGAVRFVHLAPGLEQRAVAVFGRDCGRKRIVQERAENVEVALDDACDRARAQLLSGGVDRHDGTHVRLVLAQNAMVQYVEFDAG